MLDSCPFRLSLMVLSFYSCFTLIPLTTSSTGFICFWLWTLSNFIEKSRFLALIALLLCASKRTGVLLNGPSSWLSFDILELPKGNGFLFIRQFFYKAFVEWKSFICFWVFILSCSCFPRAWIVLLLLVTIWIFSRK